MERVCSLRQILGKSSQYVVLHVTSPEIQPWNGKLPVQVGNQREQDYFSAPPFSSELPLRLADLSGRTLRRSLPPGLADAFPYHIIPRDRTSTVFMWPRTWKDTAEKRPIQMNWLRLTPMAMKHESARKNCRTRDMAW
jgi:hypothetical protein